MKAKFENTEASRKKVDKFKENCKSAFFSFLCYHVKLFYDNTDILRKLPQIVQDATYNILTENDSVDGWLKNNILNGYNYSHTVDNKKIFDTLLSRQANDYHTKDKRGLLFSLAYSNYKTYHQGLEVMQTSLSKEDFFNNLEGKNYVKQKNSNIFLEYVDSNDKRHHLVLKSVAKEEEVIERQELQESPKRARTQESQLDSLEAQPADSYDDDYD
jgi:hypothetical protein